jgi:hypothetical protein
MALYLIRDLSAGVLKIKDRKKVEGKDEPHEYFVILDAKDKDLHGPKEYADEAFVMANHPHIMGTKEQSDAWKAEKAAKAKAKKEKEAAEAAEREKKYGKGQDA